MLVIFHTENLVERVKAGLWQEAFDYVRSFVPMTESSRGADFLALFLQCLMAISGFADGNTMRAGIVCDWFKRIYRDPVLHKYPFFATIVADVLFLRCAYSTSGSTYTFVQIGQFIDVAHAYFLALLLLLQELPGLATGQEQGSRDGRGHGQQDT